MHLNEYQTAIKHLDSYESTHRGDMAVLLGVAGEAGELLEVEKKRIRDNVSFEIAQKQKLKELGDILWYVATYARRIGFDLDDIARYNIRKLEDRKDRGVLHGNGDDR